MFEGPTGLAIFDLDGTLVDSAGDIHLAANTVRSAHGLPSLSLSEASALIGLPAAALFSACSADPDPLVREFRTVLADVTGTHTTVFPCVEQVLTELQSRGWRLAVATNKPGALAQTVLEKVGLAQYFDVVQGADGLPPKPDPAVVAAAMGAAAHRTGVMIGDTTMDIEAGKSAGAATIAVAGGSHTVKELAAAKPDMLIGSLCDLAASLGWASA